MDRLIIEIQNLNRGGEHMRFNIELLLKDELIPKDKNRIFISLIKNNFKNYHKDYYKQLYEEVQNKIKDFTFAVYMGNAKFLREEILIPNKRIILNFSTSSMEEGIMFYNSFLQAKGKEYPIKNNLIKINKINLNLEKTIVEDQAIYKTLSPISVREHFGDNKKTWYHSLNDEKGQEIFMENLKYQLVNKFSEERILDIGEVEIEVLANKEVKVKHYNIEVLGNICHIRIKGKPYILDYLYKSGIGSQRSAGFGMVDLV